jgi:hypothetical protein
LLSACFANRLFCNSYWDLNLINSPDHGGPMLNGIVMPTAVVGLTGELAIDIFIAKVKKHRFVRVARVVL